MPLTSAAPQSDYPDSLPTSLDQFKGTIKFYWQV